jgi:predicted Zn-dependent protease
MVGHRPRPKKAALALAAALCACGASAPEHLEDARAGLSDAAWSDVLAAADAGLRAHPDERTAWGLSLAKLEAHGRLGRGAEALALLEELAKQHPDRIPASQYCATADQLRSAGSGAAAIQVLDLGHRQHPADPSIGRLIASSQSAGADPAELEMLKSLGYIE